MPDERVEAIRKRRQRIETGKWRGWLKEDVAEGASARVYRNADMSGVCKPTHPDIHQQILDVDFIANAPDDIDYLLTLHEEDRKVIEELRGIVRFAMDLPGAAQWRKKWASYLAK